MKRNNKITCAMPGCRYRAQPGSPHCAEHQPMLPFCDRARSQPYNFGNAESAEPASRVPEALETQSAGSSR
jgi:hypothetical protein